MSLNVLVPARTCVTALYPVFIISGMQRLCFHDLNKSFSHLGVSVATCMAILQVGSGLQLRSASTGTKEEDYENDAATIVQKCVSMMSTAFSVHYL